MSGLGPDPDVVRGSTFAIDGRQLTRGRWSRALPRKPALFDDPEGPCLGELRGWGDLHSFRMPGTRNLEQPVPNLMAASGRRRRACATSNFVLAGPKPRKRSADQRTLLLHRIPAALNPAPVGLVFAHVSGNKSGQGVSRASGVGSKDHSSKRLAGVAWFELVEPGRKDIRLACGRPRGAVKHSCGSKRSAPGEPGAPNIPQRVRQRPWSA